MTSKYNFGKRLCARLLTLLSTAVTFTVSSSAFGAATIVILNNDSAGVGFNDTTVVAPVGGNPGTTLGQQRLNAFQAAANKWGATLTSSPTITVRAQWTALTCTATSAVLGSAGAVSISRDFVGAPFASTWYSASLGNKLAGADSDPVNPEINANFNVSLGTPGCLTGTFFYLGLDGNHGANIDLVTVLTHEFGHGLGFQTFTSGTTGAQNSGFPTIYDRFLIDNGTGKSWLQMTNAERVTSAINPRKLAWDGPQVLTDAATVLAFGTPLMKINSPAGLAGNYEVGAASFGAALTAAGITGNVVQALDAADGSGPTTTDGCTALTNAAAVSGNIALIDRGTCGFTVKVKNAQDAGAIAVIIADNAAGSPPAGLGGADPLVVIPAVRITLDDGNAVKAQLGAGVNVTLKVDNTIRAGADRFGKPLMFSPNPFQSGSSVSHWDTSASPNQLMEPSINADLTHEVTPPNDLTYSQMRDIGWVVSVLPNTIVKTTGDAQSTPVNQPFATPITVTTTPAASGLTVTWTVNPSSGAGANFPSTGDRIAVSTTDALGVATAPALTANGVAGAYSMNATVPGAGTTTFTLTNNVALLPDLTISKTHSGNFAQGQVGATYTVTVNNVGAASKPAASLVTVTETVPSGLTLLAMSGAGWTCAIPSCTRSDVLAAAASYPPITVTVSVAGTATSPQVNNVAVTTAAAESNAGNNGASDSTVIVTGTAGSLTVTPAGTGTGSITSLDGGINCGATCSAVYTNGSTIQLTAAAAGGSTFTGWLGACTGNAATCTVSISGAASVTATFALSPVSARILDIDANNAYDAATDGVLILRHLFGLTGVALTNNALGTGFDPARVADPALRNYLINVLPYLDVDGNGQVDALTDGLMILRALLGLTDAQITLNAIGAGATRSPFAITAHIQSLRP